MRRRANSFTRFFDSGRVPARCTATPLAIYEEPAGGKPPTRGDDEDAGKAAAAKLLKRFRGRAEDALAAVLDENKELRDERRTLREKLPKDGTVILTADEAKQFAAFKALGTPEDVKTKITNGEAAIARASEFDRATSADKAAPLSGVNAAALRELVGKHGYEVSFVPGLDKDGKTIEVPHIKATADTAGKPVLLSEFAKANPLFGPALLAKAPAGGNGAASTGVPFVEQSSSGNGEGAGKARPAVTDRYLKPWEKAAPAAAAK